MLKYKITFTDSKTKEIDADAVQYLNGDVRFIKRLTALNVPLVEAIFIISIGNWKTIELIKGHEG